MNCKLIIVRAKNSRSSEALIIEKDLKIPLEIQPVPNCVFTERVKFGLRGCSRRQNSNPRGAATI